MGHTSKGDVECMSQDPGGLPDTDKQAGDGEHEKLKKDQDLRERLERKPGEKTSVILIVTDPTRPNM